MSRLGKVGIAAATTAAAGAIVFGGQALADAASTTAGTGTASAASEGSGGSADTLVTGAELAKVTAAVRAKGSAVTVTSVRKDPDGSYDVFATKAGAQLMYDVSTDLTTITQNNHSR
jgi:hypothetical protein